MKKIIFCTNNQHKLKEVSEILGTHITFHTLHDISYFDELPEPYFTLEENAFSKANTVFEKINIPCIAEDTGLFVPAINNEPGVFSARYAGEHATTILNIQKLLFTMQNVEDRQAYFKTIIAYIESEQKIHYFEGICKGKIAKQTSGTSGFGYDPLFIPDGYQITFSEMDAAQKNAISHRQIAFQKFKNYIQCHG